MRLADAELRFPFTPAPYGEPPPEYDELRATCPVAPVILPTGHRAWLVTTHAEAVTVGSDARFSRDVRAAGLAVSTGADFFVVNSSFAYMDPPEHTRLRDVVRPFFTPRRLEWLRHQVEEAMESCAEDFAAQGPPADLVGRLTFPFTLRVVCRLLGIEDADAGRCRTWAEVVPSLTRSGTAEIQGAVAEMGSFLTRQIAGKRAAPCDDVLTALMEAERAGRLTAQESLNVARLLFFAGQDTPNNLLSRGVLLLLRHPEQWAAVCTDPSLIDGAVEEILRYSMTSGTGLTHAAVATEDVTLAGQRIGAGEVVVTPHSAANRDPSVFARPHVFDITRTDAAAHLAFGRGIHHCLGAPLARLQMRTALAHLTRRFPDLHRADSASLTWSTDLLPNRLRELPVSW